jgi:chorismate-pyruvate lyase
VVAHRKNAELMALVDLFYPVVEELGTFEEVSPTEMPADFQRLLAHTHHMTVTVEQFHRTPVNVQVLEKRHDGQFYSRRILLSRQTDGRVVQFGIVRLDFEQLSPEVRRRIESQSAPLGRILIEHNVLREIELVALWRVSPGPDLCQLFGLSQPEITYGRTAIIHCNGSPAVELLEIVTPVAN